MASSPVARPPSTYHEFRGDVGVQDIFVAAIESNRRRGQNFRILFPGTDRYELERMDVYNYSSICHPCLIIQPKRTAEVSAIVKGYQTGVKNTLAEIKKTGANLGIPRLCVSGGRNSMNAMMEGSIVLDLSRMNGVDVDADAGTVTVQGGTRIYELDDELAKHGLMAVTGTVGRLGVVGTVLGGGYGYASRKFGLACDNIVSAELIIADGRLKRCSPSKNEDLYWSLCGGGGGGGIGVVTQLTLRCYPIQNAGLLTYDLSSPGAKARRKIVAKWADWIHDAPNEVYSHIVMRTDWKMVSFLGSSIDTEVIPQSADHLEYFHDVLKRKSLVRELSRLSGSTNSQDELPVSWDRTPGLSVLQKGTGKFGSPMRIRSKFRMVPFCDGIQSLGDVLFSPGNVYNTCKYASTMNENVVDILTKAKTDRVEAMRSVRKDNLNYDSDGEDDASLETTDERFGERPNDDGNVDAESDEDEIERRDGRSDRGQHMKYEVSSRSLGQESYMTEGIETVYEEEEDWADFNEDVLGEGRQVDPNRDDGTERSLTPSPTSTRGNRDIIEV